MRRVVLNISISLDGYIARRDGALDFLHFSSDYSMTEFFRGIDIGIMGRKTLDAAIALNGGRYDGHGLDFYVLSRSPQSRKLKGVTFTNQSPAEVVAAIRKRPGKDIWLAGGGEIAREFLAADLVDEIYLGIVPALLGDGIPLFPAGFPQRDLQLIENKTYSEGLVAMKYRRRAA
ncbi:MAG: dihydrofolate reductase [Bryobacterales bacterium]|nr:dihydrofolate reductase [Bryobacterales bacterium]